jgi:hypothetical protein
MLLNSKYVLLFIEPQLPATSDPVVDEYTLKLAYQLMHYTKYGSINYSGGFIPYTSTLGVHTCSCGARSASYDLLLPCGLGTNTLALHYLMYHRAEVPESELHKIQMMVRDPNFTMDEYQAPDKSAVKMLEDLGPIDEKDRHLLPFDFDPNKLLAKKNSYTIPQLKEILSYMGLDTAGKKADLIARITPYI